MYNEITPEVYDVNNGIIEGLGTVFVMSEPDRTEKKKWMLMSEQHKGICVYNGCGESMRTKY